MKAEELIIFAKEAMKNAYAPYSKFFVGAAVLTEDEKVYTGCNIENASYGLSICAERNAIFKAISDGNRKFKAIAIISSGKDYTKPCGACRQVMAEFSPDMTLYLANNQCEYCIFSLRELLPEMFVL